MRRWLPVVWGPVRHFDAAMKFPDFRKECSDLFKKPTCSWDEDGAVHCSGRRRAAWIHAKAGGALVSGNVHSNMERSRAFLSVPSSNSVEVFGLRSDDGVLPLLPTLFPSSNCIAECFHFRQRAAVADSTTLYMEALT